MKMQMTSILTPLFLSFVPCLLAEKDTFGSYQPRPAHHANDKGVWDNDMERDTVEGGAYVGRFGLQNVTSDESDGEGNKELDQNFDDGKVPQEISARMNVKPQDTVSETFGEFMNKSDRNIITHSPQRIAIRWSGQCKFPNDLKEAEVDCTIYPSKVVCIQTCKFGYTMEGKDGIKRRMECNKEENIWKPVPEFEKCKPFVDCGVTIGPGGSYKCRKNYIHKGPDCDIACSPYEDKEAVPAAKYECDITGKWTPQLPFCARGGSGLKLVPVPQGPKQLSDLK